jgi:hypothetical protein
MHSESASAAGCKILLAGKPTHAYNTWTTCTNTAGFYVSAILLLTTGMPLGKAYSACRKAAGEQLNSRAADSSAVEAAHL